MIQSVQIGTVAPAPWLPLLVDGKIKDRETLEINRHIFQEFAV